MRHSAIRWRRRSNKRRRATVNAWPFSAVVIAVLAVSDAVLAQDALDNTDVRGLVVAVNRATIATEISGSIIELPFREGERFSRGDTLIAIDCKRYRAALAAAAAELRGARKTFANNKELAALNSIGALEVDISKAELDRARANVGVLEQDVRHCKVTAPFDGRLVERSVQPFETVSKGDELFSILDDRTLEIELIVPAKWLRWLRADSKFEFQIDETGSTHSATVVRMGAAIDPQSQTLKVFGRFTSLPASVLPGMSGAALFPDAQG